MLLEAKGERFETFLQHKLIILETGHYLLQLNQTVFFGIDVSQLTILLSLHCFANNAIHKKKTLYVCYKDYNTANDKIDRG